MKSRKVVLLTTEYLDEKLASLLGHMDVHFAQIDKRLDGIELHLIQVDKRLDGIELHLIQVDQQLVNIDARLDGHEDRFDRLEKYVDLRADIFKEDIVRSLEPMFEKMRIDLLGYKDSMVSRTMKVEVEQLASISVVKRNQDVLDDHESRIKKLEFEQT